MIYPAIKDAAENRQINKLAGCMVVLNPQYKKVRFRVLFQHIISSEDDVTFTEIARAKAMLSFRTGLASSRVQQDCPYLYEKDDTKWGGSTVAPGGLVVAFSGVEAVFDEMISEWMASAIRALCRHEMTREGGVMSQDGSFLGQ